MTLLFRKQLITKIREGQKTQTRRLKKPNLTLGKIYHLRKNYHSVLPDKIKIIDIFQQNLGDISVVDIQKEGYNTQQEFIEAWKDIYGIYQPDDYIWVVEFQYIPATETFKEND